MVSNLSTLGEGAVRITTRLGERFTAQLRYNDRRTEVLMLEVNNGSFVSLPYAEVAFASLPLRR